jgi:hypothetical protein
MDEMICKTWKMPHYREYAPDGVKYPSNKWKQNSEYKRENNGT